jgi:hypothetical protein
MNIRSLLVATLAANFGLAGTVHAVQLSFSHAYGEIVDRGDISAHIGSSDGSLLECPTSVSYAQTGHQITLTTRKAPPGQTDDGSCRFLSSVVLGPFPAGTYQVTGRIRSVDGATFDSVTQTLVVLPIAGRCNPDPTLSPSIVGKPKGLTAAQFIARVHTDAAFAASLGNPAVRHAPYSDEVYFDYPPLDDIPPAMDRLATAGAVESQWRNGRVCFSAPPPDAIAQFVEFYHAGLDHYFYSGNAGEIADIEAGKVGPGWVRTGNSFRAITAPGCPGMRGNTVVYRFFGVPGKGPNSHFFTRDRAECSAVDASGQWSFEGLPFWAAQPGPDGSCVEHFGEQRTPLYRVWRPFGDSNHRFTTDPAVVAQMVGQGWVSEGPAMCVLPPG